MEYLRIVDLEYRTLYRAKKCTASNSDPTSGFFVTDNGNETYSGGAKYKIQCGGSGNGGGTQKNNRWSKITCHNCVKLRHISWNCFLPGGGSHNDVDYGGGTTRKTQLGKATTTYVVHPDRTNRATVPWEVDGRSSGVDNLESGGATSAHSMQ